MADLTLRPSKAPNLLIAPTSYAQQYQDQLNNALRLYFNQVDNGWSSVLGDNGARYFESPHIAAQDTTDQYAVTNTPTVVKWNTLDSGSGFTLNVDSTATAPYSGVYKIDYSLQLANTANVIHNAYVWLRVDGVDVPGSASKFTLAARKSAGVYAFVVAYSSVTFEINGGSDIALMWATDQAYNPVGPVDGVYIEHEAAQTVPFARPSIPSAIGSIVFVSRRPA